MFSAQRAAATASLTLLLGVPAGAQTQPSTQRAFSVGHTDIGPTVGLGGISGASFAIGRLLTTVSGTTLTGPSFCVNNSRTVSAMRQESY